LRRIIPTCIFQQGYMIRKYNIGNQLNGLRNFVS
jgi:hypothetical protein